MDIEELAMLLDTMDNEPPSPQAFQQAATLLQTGIFRLETEQQLIFYGLFKQSTKGDAPDLPSDAALEVTEKYKHEVWKSFRGFPRDGAMKLYVYLVNEMQTGHSEEKQAASGGFGGVFSTLAGRGSAKQGGAWSEAEQFFSLMETYQDVLSLLSNNNNNGSEEQSVQKGEIFRQMEKYLSTHLNLNNNKNMMHSNNYATSHSSNDNNADKDISCNSNANITSCTNSRDKDVELVNAEGLTALHYAADRGLADVCRLLLEHQTNVNAVDREGNTALHYAAICDHIEVAQVLLEAGADGDRRNCEGESPSEMEMVSDRMIALLSSYN